jgi:membrane protein DedA with SNARE-associated domain
MHIVIIYLGIFFGVFLEGEMIMLSSIIAAHHGYLNIWLVIGIGIIGTFSSDCFYFNLGRKKGKVLLNKSQKIKDKAHLVDRKLEKYPILIYLFYRFMYGFRSITPMVIGTSKTKTRTFLFYSSICIILWASLYTILGYMFGQFIKSELSYIEHIEKYIIGFLVLIAIVLILIFKVRKQKKLVPDVVNQ